MYKGPQHTEKSLFNTMEMEHLGGPDASLEFEANMGIKTTAATEWEVVVSPKEGAEYPERPGYRESHATWCRLPRPLKALLRHGDQVQREATQGRTLGADPEEP